MSKSILLVDDCTPWRSFVCSMVRQTPEFKIVCEVSDGLAAVQEAGKLKPDLILLDIGLPKLNGIAAARQIGQIAPKSKILFLSLESSSDVVREALRFGAGFLAKTDAQEELLPAMKAIICGRQFTSRKPMIGTGGTERQEPHPCRTRKDGAPDGWRRHKSRADTKPGHPPISGM